MSRQKYFRILLLRAKLEEKYGKNWQPPPSPQKFVGKIRSDYLFPSQKRTDYLFLAFSRSEYLFQQSTSPHPTPPLRIKWSSKLCTQNVIYVTWEKKNKEQETRAMLAAGQCRQGCGRIQCDMEESTATSSACKWLMQRLPTFISFSIKIFKGSTRKCSRLELLDAEYFSFWTRPQETGLFSQASARDFTFHSAGPYFLLMKLRRGGYK